MSKKNCKIWICELAVMKEVRNGLFIGDLKDASEVLSSDTRNQNKITHVLSVLFDSATSLPSRHGQGQLGQGAYASLGLTESLVTSILEQKELHLAISPTAKLPILRVPWKDTEDQNILDDLELCLDFIEQGRKHGAVLVHCLAGVSRSAAAVIAYLMKSEKLSLDGALASLQCVKESACPNIAFLGQLKLFEDMGFKVDHDNPIYKKFHAEKLGEAYDRGEKVGISSFAKDPALSSSGQSECAIQQLEGRVVQLYRCKKCRRLVASSDNILTHSQGSKSKPFRRKTKEEFYPWKEQKDSECTSVFVEPMQWMATVQEGGVLGKLSCPTCEARLGSFNWAGQQCSCGAWVSPAFQLHKSRVDECTF